MITSVFKKPKHSLISPEDLETVGWYTFTINPEKQFQYEIPSKRWNNCFQEIQAIISIFIAEAEIEGFLELSKLGRIHMHGYIRFKKIADFYLKLPQILDRVTIEIDYITDIETWQKYITKGKDLFKSQYQTEIKQDKMVLVKEQFIAGVYL